MLCKYGPDRRATAELMDDGWTYGEGGADGEDTAQSKCWANGFNEWKARSSARSGNRLRANETFKQMPRFPPRGVGVRSCGRPRGRSKTRPLVLREPGGGTDSGPQNRGRPAPARRLVGLRAEDLEKGVFPRNGRSRHYCACLLRDPSLR